LGFSLIIGATGSHVPHESLVQVHAACMPDAAWAVSGFPPDSSRNRRLNPGFDVVQKLSTSLQRFTRVRLPGPHLTRSCPAFSSTLTTLALYRCSLRWFGAFPRRTAPKGLPSSPAQHRYLGNHLPSALRSWHNTSVYPLRGTHGERSARRSSWFSINALWQFIPYHHPMTCFSAFLHDRAYSDVFSVGAEVFTCV
jgi:hypothetical protein